MTPRLPKYSAITVDVLRSMQIKVILKHIQSYEYPWPFAGRQLLSVPAWVLNAQRQTGSVARQSKGVSVRIVSKVACSIPAYRSMNKIVERASNATERLVEPPFPIE